MKKSLSLTEGNLYKGIILFSLPLILSNILQVLFNMADIAVVGRFSGSDSLAALGSTTMLVSLFTGFLIGLSNGVNVIVARLIGSNDEARCKTTIQTSLILSIFLGLIMMSLGLFLSTPILKLLNTKEGIIDKSSLYLKIYFLGLPGLALYNYGNSIYSASGNTKKPLIYLSIAGGINVILNLAFVIGLKLDVAGVAIASAISQSFSGALILISLVKRKDIAHLSFKGFSFNKGLAIRILQIGIPSGVQYAIFSIANMFIQSAVNSLDKVYISANAAAANADVLVWDVMAAIYVACSSFVSQNYGAGNKERVKKTIWISQLYSFLIGLVLGLLILSFGESFLGMFTKEAPVIDAGIGRLKIMAISYSISAIMDNLAAALRGVGKTIVPTIIIILGSCLFRILWIYTVFAHYKTITSLYLLYSASWLISGVALLVYFIPTIRASYKRISIDV